MTRARDLADGADKDITGTLTLDDIVLSNDMSVADDGKAIFGAGSDLQIYHNGTDSFIDETNASGWLYIRGNNTVIGKYTGETYFKGITDGAVELYHDNSKKLETTSTGVDVTGTVTADGLISDSITNESSNLAIASTQSVTIKFDSDNNQTNREFNLQRNASTTILKAEESGDITFFADNGTTQALRWDASAESLGIGTTSPERALHVEGAGIIKNTSGEALFKLQAANNSNSILELADTDDGNVGRVQYEHDNNAMLLYTNDSERLRIDSSGNLLVGKTSESDFSLSAVSVSPGASAANIKSSRSSGGTDPHVYFYNSNGLVGSITTGGSATAYNTSSDYRLKEAVVDMTGAIDRVKSLAPKRFQFIDATDVTVDGFLAHEAQAVVPEAVRGTKDEVDDDNNPVMQAIDQSKLVPLLTAALKESIAKIETLETQRADLEARLTALERA